MGDRRGIRVSAAPKVIYLNPGEILEVRIIDEPDLPKNAAEWKSQVRPPKMLMRLWQGKVALADHAHLVTH